MNQIDLRHFDLNLLVVFDVLMTERSATRAAARLGRTQSAVSYSLSRLREQFSDPLLVKGGARMQPTALALDLIEQARPMLGGIQRVLSPQHAFDPASSRRVFRLAAPDFMLSLFSDLMARLADDAPRVAVEWTAPREPTLLDIAEGQLDVAIVPSALRWPQGVTGESVGTLSWRCFARAENPAFRDWNRDDCRGPVAQYRGLGPEFLRGGADPCGLRSDIDLAGAGDEGSPARLSPGKHGGSIPVAAAAARDGLVFYPLPGCWTELVARPFAADRQAAF